VRGVDSITYTNRIISSENRAYLRSLPAHFRLEFYVNGSPWNFLMVHGSPSKINEYLFEDRADKSMLRMMQKANTHVMAFGHTHKPYHKTIEDENGEIFHAINIGSVGKPKDGDPRACYAMIEWDGDLDLKDKNDLKIEFIRVKYDVEKAAQAVEESPLPSEFADMLRNGG
jgi:diadenosine tetraphosphatase ApaH/serine/threonine PP2A family protein phosphatase